MSLQAAIELVQGAAVRGRGQVRAFAAAVQGVTGQMRRLGSTAGGVVTRGFSAAMSVVGRLRGALPSLGSSGAGAGAQLAGGAARSMVALTSLQGVMEAVAGAGLRLAGAGASYVADTLAFRENTEFAFGVLAKSSTKARELMVFSDELARSLGKDTVEVGSSVRDLLAKGFDTDMIRAVVSASADLTSINPAARVDLITKAFSDIKGKGTLGMEELKQQLADQGVSLDMVYDRLAANLGIKREQVLKTLSAGKVKADVGIASILEAMQQQFSGGKALGTASATKGATTLTGALGNTRAMARRLLLNLDTGPVGSKFIDLANKAANMLDPASDSGKKFMGVLNDATSIVGDLFKNVTADDLVSAFESATVSARNFVTSAKGFGGGFLEGYREATTTIRQLKEELGMTPGPAESSASSLRSVGKALGYIVVGIGAVVSGVVWLVGLIVDAFKTLPDNLKFIGREIMEGLGNGLESAKGWLVEKVNGIAELIPASVRKILDTHSPSRVMATIGAQVTAGLTVGLDRGPEPQKRMAEMVQPPTIARPTLPMPQAPIPAAALAGRTAGGNSIVIPLTVQVDARGVQQPERVAELVASEVRRVLRAEFAELALQVGAPA